MKSQSWILFFVLPFFALSQVDTLPLMDICNMKYEGAFRISADNFGVSSLNYSQGPIAYNPVNNSLFIVGHSHHQAIAEFAIPALSMSSVIGDLNMVDTTIQDFYSIIPGGNVENPDGLDRIGGMMVFDGPLGPELLVNCYEYYDASGSNTLVSMLIHNPDDLANIDFDGFYQMDTSPGHLCRWVSPIHEDLQDTLGGMAIAGGGVGLPIISRLSVGPSAFSFDPTSYIDADPSTEIIPIETLMDFNLGDPMHDSTLYNYNSTGAWLHNDSLDNKLMTHVSDMVYGFVVPGTRTYLVIGKSGGHEHGVCYKCTQDNGNLCGGYCTYIASDNYHYYWSFDVKDLLAVKNGDTLAHEVVPYAYGKMIIPFDDNGAAELGGASYDKDSGMLYLSLNKGDLEQGTYARPPLILGYSFTEPVAPVAVCKDITLNLNEQAYINLKPVDIDDGSILNCDTDEMKVFPNLFSCDDLGSMQTVELLITSGLGDTASCSAQLFVIDSLYPKNRKVISMTDGESGSLRQLIVDACVDDSISFDISLLNDTLYLLNSSIDLGEKNLTIMGLGIDLIYISGNLEQLVFQLDNGQHASLNNLSIIDGYVPSTTSAGGIDNHGMLQLKNVKFTNNTNSSGSAAIYNQSTGQLIISGDIIVVD